MSFFGPHILPCSIFLAGIAVLSSDRPVSTSTSRAGRKIVKRCLYETPGDAALEWPQKARLHKAAAGMKSCLKHLDGQYLV